MNHLRCIIFAAATALIASSLVRAAEAPRAQSPGWESKTLRQVDYVQSDQLLKSVCGAETDSDQKYLYTSSFPVGTICVYSVEAETGRLALVQAVKEDALRGVTDFRLSADGRLGVSSSCHSGTVALFTRDTSTGQIQIAAALDADDTGTQSMTWPVDVAFTPDAKFAYIADSKGQGKEPGDPSSGGEITVFRVADDRLEWVDSDGGLGGCFSGARGVLCHPDGVHVFVAAKTRGTLVVCRRDPESGTLQLQQSFEQGQDGVRCLEGAMNVSLSPDGRFVYTVAGMFGTAGGVGVFEIGDDRWVRLVQQFVNGDDGFRNFVGGNKCIVSADGKRAYASATLSSSLAVFDRDLETGKLTLVEMLVNEVGGVQLPGANGLAFAGEDRFLVVTCELGNAIAVLEIRS